MGQGVGRLFLLGHYTSDFPLGTGFSGFLFSIKYGVRTNFHLTLNGVRLITLVHKRCKHMISVPAIGERDEFRAYHS